MITLHKSVITPLYLKVLNNNCFNAKQNGRSGERNISFVKIASMVTYYDSSCCRSFSN